MAPSGWGRGEATMRTLGFAMVTALALLISTYCAVNAAPVCDLNGYDHTPPRAIPGGLANPLVNIEYASDADERPGGGMRIWNYVLNKHKTKGIGVTWAKAEIGVPVWRPLPPGEAACKFSSADTVVVDPDAPIRYGTTDQEQKASVYVAENVRKLGSTDSTIVASYTDADGKTVPLHVRVTSFQTPTGIIITLDRPPGITLGIANLPQVLSLQQIETITSNAKFQNTVVQRATYFQYTKEDPKKALGSLFQPEKAPNEKTDFLFFSGPASLTKVDLEVPAGVSVEKVSTDMVVLDENRQPVFGTGVSLLVPAR